MSSRWGSPVSQTQHPLPQVTLQCAPARNGNELVFPYTVTNGGPGDVYVSDAFHHVDPVTHAVSVDHALVSIQMEPDNFALILRGVPPRTMGIGPVPSTAKALDRAGLKLADIDLIELNEAFAAQVLAVTREWGFTPSDFERMNVNGSGISIGHPIGATGGRIMATLANEMQRRGARYGLETMCIGGGQGIAAVVERVG